MNDIKHGWQSVLTLDSDRQVIAGSEEKLAGAIRRGVDLRIYTEFRNNEHLDTSSSNDELVQELFSWFFFLRLLGSFHL